MNKTRSIAKTFMLSVAIVALSVATFANQLAPDVSAAATKVRWGYYVTYNPSSLASLRENIHSLDIVSPYFYHLESDGTITSMRQETAATVMEASDAKIVPMIKNVPRWDDFSKTLETPEKRDKIIDRIVALVKQYDYDGFHIDFEAVNATDQGLVTDFQKRLWERLHPDGKLVTQAVIPRHSDATSVWGGAYNYADLAKYNDYIVIMAYDQYSVGSQTSGPVAAIGWVDSITDYSLSRIPSEKILLGMPLYGYDRNLDEGPPAAAMEHHMTVDRMNRPGATHGYNTEFESPWVRYVDDNGDDHEIWYDDARSIAAKIKLMIDKDLAGFALWRLGQEDPAVWDEIAILSTPATRVAPFQDTSTRRYFDATGHSLQWGFKRYWELNGALPVFGYPRTEEFIELNADTRREHTVQYFERQRFEYHPEHTGTPYEVLLGRLGVEDAKRRGLANTAAFVPQAENDPRSNNCQFFTQTRHTVCDGFKDYWNNHGLDFGDAGFSHRESLALFGYPISEPFTDPTTGVTVQYFERARFEWHPENAGTPHEVLLGLLGNDELRQKGWIR